tara:strand:- start:1071 stop:1325 length:255 start_codon:yes stop_codon:yes gene_type:complete
MYNIQKEFDKIWSRAREANKAAGMDRFRKIEEARGSKFKVFGIYDTKSHKYVTFDSVNFAGNFRYDKNAKPKELREMDSLISNA